MANGSIQRTYSKAESGHPWRMLRAMLKHELFLLQTSNFVHGLAMCLSLVMNKCSLSGHGQGHVSNFYIVDLENFATASRRYTGDIHNSSVVGLFMTPIGQWK